MLLTGKAEYHVGANGDFSRAAAFDGVNESRHGVPPANAIQGLILCRLEAVFQPDEMLFAKHRQVVEGFIGNAVGTSAYAEANNIGICEGFAVEGRQPGQRRICVGK